MASVLSLPLASPTDLPIGESVYIRSQTSLVDDSYTVKQYRIRSNSHTSFATAASSLISERILNCKENSPLNGSTSSLANFRLFENFSSATPPRRSWSWNLVIESTKVHYKHPATLSSHELEQERPEEDVRELEITALRVANPDHAPQVAETSSFVDLNRNDSSSSELDDILEEAISGGSTRFTTPETKNQKESLDEPPIGNHGSPFKRWLRVLRKRSESQPEQLKAPENRWTLDNIDATSCSRLPPAMQPRHKKTSSSVSSVALLAAVKTASVTLASMSIYPKSRRSLQASYLRQDSSNHILTDERNSLESAITAGGPTVDDGIWSRSVQRQRIVEEISSSEESYVRDLRVLLNVYLPAVPLKPGQDRKQIRMAVVEMLQLHDDLNSQLHAILNISDHGIHDKRARSHRPFTRHIRWHSLENSPPRTFVRTRIDRFARHSIDTSRPSLIHTNAFMADTKLVMEVAQIFDRLMHRFLIYEEFAANNEVLVDSATKLKTNIMWPDTELGIEALSSLTTPLVNREVDLHKALTLGDLIVKPIQRICKYPLFFAELCKHTPACDDPVVHAELQKLLMRVQGLAEEVNCAMSNPEHLDRTAVLSRLGRVLLCGVLHVAYSTSDDIEGYYMICILYRSTLILAMLGKHTGSYEVKLSIPLLNSVMDGPDNSKGLQCHTAQFSWKLIFSIERCQHEIILSACSEKEEEVWRSHLLARMTAQTAEYCDGRLNPLDTLAICHLEIKANGPGLAALPNFSRRASIQRAATLGPRWSIQQVIIKNTEAPKFSDNSTSTAMMRSQSHMSSNNIKILAPRRSDRCKLENSISDIWTKSLLPFPGMGGRRGDHHIRASANSVMRKLSMASIASNFSKRSMSYTTLSFQRADDGNASFSARSDRTVRPHKASDMRKGPVVVNFHTAPDAFLPEDFELSIRSPKPLSRRSRKLLGRMSTPGLEPAKPQAARKPVVMSATNTVRSQAAVVVDDTAGKIEAMPSIPSTSSLEIVVVDLEKAVMFEKSQTIGETPSKKANKARKRIFRLFG